MKTHCNGIEITLKDGIEPFTAKLSCHEDEVKGIFYVDLRLRSDAKAQLPDLELTWDLPSIDFHYKWNPQCMHNRALDIAEASANRVESRANRHAPVYSLYNLGGISTCCFALSDAVHDTVLGGLYGDGKFYESAAIIKGSKIDPVKEYTVTLRFDFRRIPYYQALKDVTLWWQEMDEYAPCKIPDAARMPLLSSWYSYKLEVDPSDLEKQCALAKEYGMDVVILDDGWQTDQLDFGYQNNGDWEVSTIKFPDFAAHVKHVQDLGMKYMVWFSVPFVGLESKAYQKFKDMVFEGKEGAKWFALDPRFPEVRNYLAETYENFVRRYNIDGIKMDFIGSIRGRGNDEDNHDEGRDCHSVGEGVCRLLDDVMRRLHAVNDEILIEFRQAYVGPAMRKYGNMFRAVDCPNSIGDNRVRGIDVRLICGDTAAHADPITWHDDDPVESAAMQLIHTLFCVPQISRKMTDLTDRHTQMLRSYLSFWRTHQEVLLSGELRPLFPNMSYPLVIAEKDAKTVAAFYSRLPLVLDNQIPDELILVNGTYSNDLLLDIKEDRGKFDLTATDCMGSVVHEERITLHSGINVIPVSAAGHIQLKKI
jgi:alpha-galactosidase